MISLLLVLIPLVHAIDIVDIVNDAQTTWHAAPFEPVRGLTPAEIRARFLGVQDDARPPPPPNMPASDRAPPTPAAFDWRTANSSLAPCIGPVVNQGKCGSCWAVSAVEALGDRRCIAMRRGPSPS